VPEIGDDVSCFAEILDESGYFEPAVLSPEDLERARLYSENAVRREVESSFKDYGQYLASLQMEAEIQPFSPVYLDRIAQLTNKTNQFNLTTRRYTRSELEDFAARPGCVTLYGRLTDRFGDNGLVTIVMGFFEEGVLEIDLWLMSCRVLKRDMEFAMLDKLVEAAIAKNANRLRGRYIRSEKNRMVAGHYEKLGFQCISSTADGSETVWELPLDRLQYRPRNRYIRDRDNDLAGSLAETSAHIS
jgi:FkbH-like protein